MGEPNEEELQFVMKTADTGGDGSIHITELEEVLVCWLTFVDNREKWEKKMEEFDKTNTGYLNKEECRAYLVSVNEGKPLEDEEFEAVFKEADILGDGQINKMELQKATSLWYAYVEEQRKGCCSVQ